MPGKQLTIIWAVDDVLNSLTRSWFEEFWMPGHQECAVRYGQILENPPHALLGINSKEYLASLDQYRSVAFSRFEPVREVMDWFRCHGHRGRHMALTATPLRSAPYSAEWVMRHFGTWIRSFHFVPSRREGEQIPQYDLSKESFLAELGRGDVFLDDSPWNIEGAARVGLKTILIPQPWNESRQSLSEALQSLTQLL